MPGASSYTYNRPTDILADEILSRLGNTGTGLLKDLLSRINQAFGFPIELRAQTPTSTSIDVGPGIYSMPDSSRFGFYENAVISELVSGVIDFTAGTISTGGVSGFSLPTMTDDYYIKSLICYDVVSNSLDVVFGAEGITLVAATVPEPPTGFEPIYLIEMCSPDGGTGNWDNITQDDIIKLSSMEAVVQPKLEVQSTAASAQTIFNLTTIIIPNDRNRLFILINGIKCDQSMYTVTSDTQVTFITAIPAYTKKIEFLIV